MLVSHNLVIEFELWSQKDQERFSLSSVTLSRLISLTCGVLIYESGLIIPSMLQRNDKDK